MGLHVFTYWAKDVGGTDLSTSVSLYMLAC